MLELSQPLQSIGTRADPITYNYANLFESPDPDLSNALEWAHANAMHPHVSAWLRACSQWDSAVATKEHEHRKKRRKLCKEHDITCTEVVDTNKELETAMVYIRRQLTDRIKDIRTQPLLQSKATGPRSAHSMQQRAVSADTTLQPDTMVPPVETKWLAIRCWVKCIANGTPVQPFACAGPQVATPMPGPGTSHPVCLGQRSLDKYMKPGICPELLPAKNEVNAERALATKSPSANTNATTADEMMVHTRSLLE
jgi:hypothetical protein